MAERTAINKKARIIDLGFLYLPAINRKVLNQTKLLPGG
jgi:hypothetical protein